jgi:hypothetical protein
METDAWAWLAELKAQQPRFTWTAESIVVASLRCANHDDMKSGHPLSRFENMDLSE